MKKKRICVISQDANLGHRVCQRLCSILPTFSFSFYPTLDLANSAKADMIICDNRFFSSDDLGTRLPMLNLFEDQTDMTTISSARHLAEAIRHHFSILSFRDTSQDDTAYENRHVHMLLSLADIMTREAYVKSLCTSLFPASKKLFRINLMPGIYMPSSEPDKGSSAKGFSDLLLRAEQKTSLCLDDYLAYVHLDENNCLCFSHPDRSDDILLAPTDVLCRLVSDLRRLCDEKDAKIRFLVVIEALPFVTMMRLCSLAQELHVLLPSDDIVDISFAQDELHRLFAGIDPWVKRHIHAYSEVKQ